MGIDYLELLQILCHLMVSESCHTGYPIRSHGLGQWCQSNDLQPQDMQLLITGSSRWFGITGVGRVAMGSDAHR